MAFTTLLSSALLIASGLTAGTDRLAANSPDWDLKPVFVDAKAVTSEQAAIDAELPKFADWQGKLADPAAALAALDFRSTLRGRATRLTFYANMRLSRDGGDTVASADASAATALFARLNAASAYIEPELVALGANRLAAFAADPRLARHRFTIEQLAMRAAHVLTADQEILVAGVAPLQSAPATIRDVFTNAELPWPSITIRGENKRLNVQGFGKALQDPDRDVRRRAWEAFSTTRASFQQTEGALLAAYLAGEAWEAKLRKWPNQTDFVTAYDPMPHGAFAALTTEAEGAVRGPMARYIALKAKKLGIVAMASYDLGAPFVTDTRRFTIDEAKAMTLAAVAPLGPEYRDRLAIGLSGKLMDWTPQSTKGSGANTFYVGADVPGYVELSFTGDYNSVSSLAHEWGHRMHWEYSRRSGSPYETLFPPVSVGDAPSFLHEMLLADAQIAAARTHEDRIIALTGAIEELRGTFYNVVSEASFDLALRDASDRGDNLDPDTISRLYCSARKRFSPAGIAWDPKDCLGWVTEPYVFYDLYFYRYLLATSAAAWFVEKVERKDQATISKYKTFLAAGGSADASTLLKGAGFDPADRATYAAMTRRLDHLVTMLDKETSARD